jgi:hypothetical protein
MCLDAISRSVIPMLVGSNVLRFRDANQEKGQTDDERH